MSLTEEQIKQVLSVTIDPNTGKSYVAGKAVRNIRIAGADVSLDIELGYPAATRFDAVRQQVIAALKALPGIGNVSVGVSSKIVAHAVQMGVKLLPGVKNIIAVASGKGGVGKSTTAVNLALALAQEGARVGLLDADIYGHSIPQMLGLMDAMPTSVDGMIMPVPTMGLRVISIGMLKQSRDQVIAWRGPILDRALQQFLADVYWGDLDFLVVDLPPGTGDVALSLGQKVPNAEVLVVTTPQQASAEVAERAGTMASMLEQKVIGVVENMAYLDVVCPHCGQSHRVDVFGTGGGAEVAGTLSTRLGYEVPLLAEIPMDPKLAAGGDLGVPLVATDPERPAAAAVMALAERLASRKRNLAGFKMGLTPVG